MFPTLPPIPTWEGLHPIIVHFPIALLLVAPLFLVLPLLFRKHARALSGAALLLMLAGTAGAIIAVETGEAAGQLADFEDLEKGPPVLKEHQQFAERTRNIFIGLSVLYAAGWLASLRMKKTLPAWVVPGSQVLFLALYLLGSAQLAHTGHLGGRLVHEFGIRAEVAAPASGGSPSVPAP